MSQRFVLRVKDVTATALIKTSPSLGRAMPEYSEKGLTLRWDGADLVPSAGQSLGPRVVVAARPPHPSNAVTAIYTVDGGAPRVARGYRLQLSPRSDGEEWFAIDLPTSGQRRPSGLRPDPVLLGPGSRSAPRWVSRRRPLPRRRRLPPGRP